MRSTDQIIEVYRKNRKITQEDLAKSIGMSRPHLSNALNEKRNFSNETLQKIMDFLDISNQDRAEILEYEDFRKCPDSFQTKYFILEKKLEAAERKIQKYESGGLKELDDILENYYLNHRK